MKRMSKFYIYFTGMYVLRLVIRYNTHNHVSDDWNLTADRNKCIF